MCQIFAAVCIPKLIFKIILSDELSRNTRVAFFFGGGGGTFTVLHMYGYET